MKHFLRRLDSWWFSTMVPIRTPLTSIHQREVLRKRRLLSLIAFISALLVLSTFPLAKLLNVSWMQMGILCLLYLVMLLTIFINQRGYLFHAGFFYVFSTSFLEMLFIRNESHSIPILSFCLWPILLIPIVTAGMFLPVWGSLLYGIVVILFMVWFMLFDCQQQIAMYITDPHIQWVVLIFSCLVIFGLAVYISLFTATTENAVIRADHADELEQAHQELKAALAKIQRQASTDGLTGLLNRRAVLDQLKQELERARHYDRSFSLLFFDADHFKEINDTYGHPTGDTVLCQISEWASGALRKGDILGRFGGEEFIALLPEINTQEVALIAERVRASIASSSIAVSGGKADIAITVSIGIATYHLDGDCEQELLSQADKAMYMAKQLGRNQICTALEARKIRAKTKTMMTI